MLNEIQQKIGGKQPSRARNWLFIVYPESAPKNWIEAINDLHIQACVSPLHDKDIDATGELKKAHYHVLVTFDGVKSFDQIKAITDSLNSPIPIQAHSIKGAVRYFVHLDDPDKYQYKTSDILSLGGFDVVEALKPSSADRYTMIGEMIDYIQDFQITEFEDILIYARKNKKDTWFPLLCDDSSYVIGKAIDSKRNRYKDGSVLSGNKLLDVKTGKLIEDKSYLFSDDDK